MRYLLLNSLTPFVYSDIEPKTLQIVGKCVNVLWCTAACVSAIIMGVCNPWEFGHIPTAVATLIVWIVVGILFQILREYDINDKEEGYIRKEIESNEIASETEKKEESLTESQKVKQKPGPHNIELGESPFATKDNEDRFSEIMANEMTLINTAKARALVNVLKGHKGVKKDAKINTIVHWIIHKYPDKFTKNEQSIKTAKNYRNFERYWSTKIDEAQID